MRNAQPAAFSMLAPVPGPSHAMAGEWRVASAHAGQGIEAGYADPAFDDAHWEAVSLPHLRRATAAWDTLWYRYHFAVEPLPPGRRAGLRFGGAFYHTQAWLNGRVLGSHTGYFQPFGFDITDQLEAGDHECVLAVCCRFPIEAGAFNRKTAIAGIFADWDCKPYPSTYYPDLPAPHEWSVPLGLWRPVTLHSLDSLLIESLNIFPELDRPTWPERPDDPGAGQAHLRIVVGLRNLVPEPQSRSVIVEVGPHNFAGHTRVCGQWTVALEGGESCRVEYRLALPEPRLWFPWTHGAPWLYRARLTLGSNIGPPPETRQESGESEVSHEVVQTFGVRSVQALIGPDRWEWWFNGRRIFPKGSNYVSDFYLDRVNPEGLARDLDLARGANLDLLRVHAHIAPQDFYRLCDERGLLVMCDFPLIWAYAFGLPPSEEAAFQVNVVEQAEAMVGLLGSHPSIVLWSMHNEPPWTPDGSFLGSDLHQAETNRRTDDAAAERVRTLDSTRPVIRASGEHDRHLYHGWYTGQWQDNGRLAPAFPTEFGVQALPSLHSPFWATVNTNWPIEADDAGWAHAGYQSIFWASPGVGAPAQFASLADYVAESQAYQAFYIRFTIDQWRRHKFNPVSGYIHFLFTDGWPAITWSVLDYYRLRKAGYQALAEASRPLHVCLDLGDGYSLEGGFHIVYPVGGQLRLGLYLVNDDYRLSGGAQVAWWLERRDERPTGTLLRRIRRWMGSERLTLEIPHAEDGARLIGNVQMPLTAPGEYTFRVRVTQGPDLLDENHMELRVGAVRPQHKHPRRVPGLLLNRVYRAGSLRHTADGFTFSMSNPAMPVVLQRLLELRIDHAPIAAAQIEIVSGGMSRRASTITPQAPLELPSGGRFAVVVGGYPLAPGPHELELTAQFLGLGEITARVRDKLI